METASSPSSSLDAARLCQTSDLPTAPGSAIRSALAQPRWCILGRATDRPGFRLPGSLVAPGAGQHRHCRDGARDPPVLAWPPRLGCLRWVRRIRYLLANCIGAIGFRTSRVARRSGDLIRSWMTSGASLYLKPSAPDRLTPLGS
jgi:hypothetical protein